MAAKPTGTEVLIRQRLRALSGTLPDARKGDVASIHRARVATRRLREALPLVGSRPTRRKLQRAVRRITQALGPVRELDVALITLDELGKAKEAPRGGLQCLAQAIRDERRRLHHDMVQSVDRIDLEKLTRRAVAAARKRDARSEEAPRGRDPRQIARAHRRAALRGERLRAAIENAASIYLPDRLHEVRIAVKKLRYAMEIARELSGSRATARIMTLKRAQDLLGRMHDLEVLIARTRAIQGSANAPTLRLSAELDQVVRRLENECRQLHGQYIASRKALLAICDHVATTAAQGRESAA